MSLCVDFFVLQKTMSKKIVYAYIDWFNLYHNLQYKIRKEPDYWNKSFQRCNLRKLLESKLQEDEELHMVYFFTAYAEWSLKAVQRHKILNKALRNVWVDVVLWKFSKVTRKYTNKHWWLVDIYYDAEDQMTCMTWCEVKNLKYITYEEKETDVNMSLKILEDWLLEKYDKALIISWDSDIVPPITRIKNVCKAWKILKKEFTNIVIPGTKWKTMRRACDNHEILEYSTFQNSLFEEKIITTWWEELCKPSSRSDVL
jgi:uncharacterized LabA/DUF88 family protein